VRKPDSLRAALTAALLDADGQQLLKRNPDRLSMFIDQGAIAVRMNPGAAGQLQGYEWRYRLQILLQDFPADKPDEVAIVIVQWLAVHQPDLLLNHARGNDAVKFECDPGDENTVDLQLDLQLTEAVQLVPNAGGGTDIVYPPEPSLIPPAIGGALDAGYAFDGLAAAQVLGG